MTVEIWSDIACPFCYIGKRRFERALAQFEGKDQVEITWRSFQINPDLVTEPNTAAAESLAKNKGWTLDQARQAQAHVAQMAAGEGLAYDFDGQVVANTFDAHRFTHFAKQHGKQIEAEEALFAAHFTEGKNIADHDVLAGLGAAIGLDPLAVKAALASEDFADRVVEDILLARQFGISSVPFFVFDRKYAVSGAQEAGMFLQAFENAMR
jgi:predicted DsbA family dithiol-disulfide isomerase